MLPKLHVKNTVFNIPNARHWKRQHTGRGDAKSTQKDINYPDQ